MKILSIETSADETAVSVVSVTGDFPEATYELQGNALKTQIEMHQQYGGIFPSMAKREHAKALVPLLTTALKEADLLTEAASELSQLQTEQLCELLHREPGMADTFITFLETHEQPDIDVIAVTAGPGLEPALWVGVNFAKALALTWDTPVVPVNHMEGHILASIYDSDEDDALSKIAFPALALLISGGHTELVLVKQWGRYEKIGQTRDDAVGEAFDKVARLMGLPYPGGPEIGKLAQKARTKNLPPYTDLPTPMLHSGDLDFSFSGLKTAVRYAIADKELTETDMQALARDFEDAVGTVLLKKCVDAIDTHDIQTLVVGGGVSASQYLRGLFQLKLAETHPDLAVYFPMPGLSTDNSIMIALAGHAKLDSKLTPQAANELIKADGNKSLA